MIGTGSMPRNGIRAALIPLFLAAVAAGNGPFDGMSPGLSAVPTLRADTAVYDQEHGVLQYAFTFVNPSDSVLFLDCQVPPRASLSGSTLILDFDRQSPAFVRKGGPDSAASPPGAEPLAGGPVDGVVDANAFPPQRIGANHTFQGQRRLDRVLGDYRARPKFTSLRLRMAFYPERDSGEGEPFVLERRMQAESRNVNVVRRGKMPAPAKGTKKRVPAEGSR